ncbi:hypothetical protein Cgig2_004501 [Carnegiea gigantea]|uniref:NAC domain-containing protein n=1 Tax=Carnegiea gigantea TaxID=171969 RepID=A0A9Q1JFJ9_9CARY|nr:hypothetical protein Cgig2_004501 [Carnegiea gigantea]
MVFYQRRARNHRSEPATKTEWKMNECMVINLAHQPPFSPATAVGKGDYSVCRAYKKSKCGRAFERRPPAARTVRSRSIASSDLQAVDHYKQRPKSSDHHENQSRLMVEIVPSSSVEISSPSSGDHAGNSNVNQYIDGDDQENNMDLDKGQAPLWDFDSLNWSF